MSQVEITNKYVLAILNFISPIPQKGCSQRNSKSAPSNNTSSISMDHNETHLVRKVKTSLNGRPSSDNVRVRCRRRKGQKVGWFGRCLATFEPYSPTTIQIDTQIPVRLNISRSCEHALSIGDTSEYLNFCRFFFKKNSRWVACTLPARGLVRHSSTFIVTVLIAFTIHPFFGFVRGFFVK